MDLYAKLFEEYVIELEEAREDAIKWWNKVIQIEGEILGDRNKAEFFVRWRWPLGPTSHPRVIAVFRKYYLAIEDINRELLEKEEQGEFTFKLPEEGMWGINDEMAEQDSLIQHPRTILFERLEEAAEPLARFMDSLVFIPIGADSDGLLE